MYQSIYQSTRYLYIQTLHLAPLTGMTVSCLLGNDPTSSAHLFCWKFLLFFLAASIPAPPRLMGSIPAQAFSDPSRDDLLGSAPWSSWAGACSESFPKAPPVFSWRRVVVLLKYKFYPRLRSWALLETGLFFCIYPDLPPSACHRGTASPQHDATTVFGCRLVLMRWCSSPGFSPHIRREPLPNGSNFIWWEQGILWSESRSGLPAWAVLRLVLKNCFCLPFFLDDWSAAGTVVL